MRVMVAGATGSIGAGLVPLLVARGHTVVGLTRSAEKAEALKRWGAEPVVVDALDGAAVRAAALAARPEVVVHELTALKTAIDLAHFDRALAATNRLRTEGLDILNSDRGGARVRSATIHRAELLRLALRTPRRTGQNGRGSARSVTAAGVRQLAERDPPSRGRRGGGARVRRPRAALRRLLRASFGRFRWLHGRSSATAAHAADRRRRRLVVVPAR